MRRQTRAARDLLVELLNHLAETQTSPEERDVERAHYDADNALVEFIGDPRVTAAYDRLERWYA